jgi:hypothetical protein
MTAMRNKHFLAILSSLLLLVFNSQADVLAYWSFNNQSVHADVGTAHLSASWFGVGPGTLVYATGTELNAQPDYAAAWALGYVDIVTALTDHRIEISGLDFSGLTDAELSFAATSTEVFGIGEEAIIHYRIGNGSWVKFTEIALPTATWRVDSVDFGDLFDGHSHVSIRIDYRATFDLGSSLRFDNITVSAVPEPNFGAALIAVVAGIVGRRRPRRAA